MEQIISLWEFLAHSSLLYLRKSAPARRASLRSHPAWRTWTSRPTCLRRGARSAPGATTTHPPTPRPPRRAPSADPSLLPPTSAATAVNRLKNLVGAGSGRASGVDTDEEMATAAARTTISGE